MCPAGTGGAICQPCAAGSFSTGGTAEQPYKACAPCSAGWTTQGTGQASCTGAPTRARARVVPETAHHEAAPINMSRIHSFFSPTYPPTAHPLTKCKVCQPGYGGASCAICPLTMYSKGGGQPFNPTNLTPDCIVCQPGLMSAGQPGSTSHECICERAPQRRAWMALDGCALVCLGPGALPARRVFASVAARTPACLGRLPGSKPAIGKQRLRQHAHPPPLPHPLKDCAPGYWGPYCTLTKEGWWASGGTNATNRTPWRQPCPPGRWTLGKGATSPDNCTGTRTYAWSVWTRWLPSSHVSACPSTAFDAKKLAAPPSPQLAIVVCAPGHGGENCTTCATGSWSPGGNASTPFPPCTKCGDGNTTLRLGGGANSSLECTRGLAPARSA